MNKVKPLSVGASLSATVVVMYLLCALGAWLVPAGVESVIKMVTHSLNLNPLFDQVPTVTLAGVVGGSVAVAVYFFVTGVVFGWIYNRFARA